MKKFSTFTNEFITEGSTAISTDAEEVIVSLWNIFHDNKSLSYEAFQKLRSKDRRIITTFVDKYAGQRPSKTKPGLPKKPEAYKVMYEFGKNLTQKGAGISGRATHSGSSKPAVSGKWKEITNKSKDTSKSDLNIGNAGISVKNGAGARLMSGGKDESKATIVTAMKLSGAEERIKKEMLNLIDQFASSTEIHITDVLSKGTTTELAKTEISDLKSEINIKAKQVFEQADNLRHQCKSLFNRVFSNDVSFKSSFAYEASTGWEKFGGKVFGTAGKDAGRAEYMLAFSPDFKRVRFDHMSSVGSAVVKHIASQMSFSADMKSGRFPSKGKKKGYRFFQTFQLGLKTEFTKVDELIIETNESIEQYGNMLSEGLLTELEAWNKIKGLVSKMWNGIKSIFGKIWNLIKTFTKEASKAIEVGVTGMTNFFGFDFTVSHNTEFKLI